MIRGFASPEPCYRFAKGHPEANQFLPQNAKHHCILTWPRYLLGPASTMPRTTGMKAAVRAAIGAGINFVDTSLNYRNQRSERAVGRALNSLLEAGGLETGNK